MGVVNRVSLEIAAVYVQGVDKYSRYRGSNKALQVSGCACRHECRMGAMQMVGWMGVAEGASEKPG